MGGSKDWRLQVTPDATAQEMKRTFTESLNELFDNREEATGRRQSLSEFLSDFERVTGTRISKGYLSELRSGVVTDPRLELIRAFARYFDVPASYFLGDGDETDSAHAELTRSLTAAGAQIGLRAGGLSEQSMRELTRLIDDLREQEGLAAVDDDYPTAER
ncbi:transcriptional regulator [Tsukamurella strandjordii]|uniref:Transcriptional regulator n=1 Tax=Tsukamurella strandjordii TaxID=147577 RepID=A0AA90NEI8_9ACTN|nr:transcriptional regulator [Tsukamurella strandjordii]MDP0396990.1 transcriptional regulator [Tsukamurella strandjordii]